MKYALFIFFFLSISTVSHAQRSNTDSLFKNIIGTWELSENQLANGATNEEKSVCFRLFTGSHYTESRQNANTGELHASVTGTYSQLDSATGTENYIEHTLCATFGVETKPDKPLSKNVAFDDLGRLVFSWTDGGVDYKQVWSRIKERPITQDSTRTANATKIIGAWDLLRYDYGNGHVVDQSTHRFRRFKLHDGSSFSVADIDPRTYVTKTAFTGNYNVRDADSGESNYIENQLSLSDKLPNGDKKEFATNIRFDGDNLMIIEWMSGKEKCSETWMRMFGKNQYPAGLHPKTLYVIGVGEKFLLAKPNKKYPDPFSVFDKKDIKSREYIHDATAAQKFGSDAIYGVMLINVTESTLMKVLSKLRAQKNVE